MRDRFREAEAIDQRVIRDASGRPVERWRLVRRGPAAGRLARVVDRLAQDPATGEFVPVRQEAMWADSIVVAIPRNRPRDDLAAELEQAGFAVAPGRPTDAVLDVRLPTADLDAVPAALARVAAEFPDLTAEPNYLYFPTQSTPSDYQPEKMWGLENIEATAAWAVSRGSASVVVAVIDSGLQTGHPDLAGNLWTNTGEVAGNGQDDDGNGFVDDTHGWDFVGDTGSLTDPDSHGTHVAGTIGAVGDNTIGLVGVNWSVRLMPLRVGDLEFSSTATLNALRYVNTMRQRGVNIVAVNASWGGDSFSTLFRDELVDARDNGVLFVAAAGNDSTDNDTILFYPASYDVGNVIAVASIHQGNALSAFSNWGDTTVDLAAPGTGIRSTVPTSSYAVFDGTSMAAPHVTGAVALVAAANPTFSWSQLRTRIFSTVEPTPALTGRVVTGGRLNLRRALSPDSHRVRVVIDEPAARVVVLDRAGLVLDAHAAVAPDGGVTPAAALSWELEGPAGGATLAPAAGDSTSVRFSATGVYRLRVRAVGSNQTSTDEITVAVGGSAPPTSGLRAWWRFEEASGAVAADSSGNGNTGTINGAAHTSAGAIGRGLVFDGTSSNMSFAAPSLPRLSYVAWVRAEAAGNSIFPRIVHMQDGLLFFGLGAADGADGNHNALKFALDNTMDGRVWHAAPDTVGLGQTYHVAVTYDGTATGNSPQLFIDGVRQSASEQSGAAVSDTPGVSAGVGYVGFGRVWDEVNGIFLTRAWDGLLDEIRIYNRQLGAGEIALLAAEVRLQRLTGAAVGAASVLPDGTVAVALTPPAGGFPAGTAIAWSVTDPAVAEIVDSGGPAATVLGLSTGGTFVQAAATFDGTTVVHSAPLTVLEAFVPTGVYQSGVADGALVRLLAGDGGPYFLSGGGGLAGVFGRGFAIDRAGAFSFVDANGVAVEGQVAPDGSFSGTIGGVAFSGARTGGPASAGDALAWFAGYATDSAVPVHAVMTGDDALAVVVSDADGGTLLPMAGTAGAFVSEPGFPDASGTLAADVFDGTVPAAPAGGAGRRIVLVRDGVEKARRVANLSARGVASDGDEMIAGFVIVGGDAQVLLRAVGPGLAQFGVPGVLGQLRMDLHDGDTVIASNQRWHAAPDAAELAAAAATVGAFPLRETDDDAALLATLPPRPHSAVVFALNGQRGVVLAEAYDASPDVSRSPLTNISARARVGRDFDVLIAGFVVEGEVPQLLLIRGVGPELVNYGIETGFLADPEIEVFRRILVEGEPVEVGIAANDNWFESAEASRIAGVAAVAGAFPLAADGRDAAVLIYLPPGVYSAIVRGVAGSEGTALAEVYRVSEEP